MATYQVIKNKLFHGKFYCRMSTRSTRSTTQKATTESLKAKTDSSKVTKKPKEVKKPKESKDTNWTVGKPITSIVLKNEKEEDVDLLKEAQESGLVIFFYPRANTPGCTTQGCIYRDEYANFKKLGYKVFGCSADSPKSQTTFITKQKFNYSLLSDPQKELIKAIGASSGASTIRSHIVIGKGGVLLDARIKISPKDSAAQALEFIKSQ
jgi:peroxiredoxin Q/BCP